MEAFGTTMILANGPAAGVGDLRTDLAAAEAGLSGARLRNRFPQLWDGSGSALEIDSDGSSVMLTVCLPGDMHAFELSLELARRYPQLSFDSHYFGELSPGEFTKARHAGGREEFCVAFDGEFQCLVKDRAIPYQATEVLFYRRTSERELALRYSGKPGLEALKERAAGAGWGRSDDGDANGSYLLPGPVGSSSVLALSLPEGGTLLEGVDDHGGFGSATWIEATDIPLRVPVLAGEIAFRTAALKASMLKAEAPVHAGPGGSEGW